MRFIIEDDEDCVIQADYMHPGSETASEPRVEIVPLGDNRYVAYANGFTGNVSFAWKITPKRAGTAITVFNPPGLAATNLQVVDLTGVTEGIRGALTVTATTGMGSSMVSVSETILTPYFALDDDRGSLTTINGDIEVP